MRRKDREVTTKALLWEMAEQGRLLHLAMIDPEGKPYSVSVHYAPCEEGNCLYFHGAMQGRKAETLKAHPDVAFDIVAQFEMVPRPAKPHRLLGIYRSLMGSGRVRIVTDLDEKRRAIAMIQKHYGDYDEAYEVSDLKLEKVVNVFALEISELTGKIKGYRNPDKPNSPVVKEQ